MSHQRTLAVIVIVSILGALGLVVKNKQAVLEWRRTFFNQAAVDPADPETPPAPDDTGKTIAIKKLRVISSGTFDLVLENDTRILARLDVMAVDDKSSTQKVVTFLNQSSNPRVVLRKRMPWNPEGTIWTVDFLLSNAGQEINLADWMRQNKLVYQ